MIPDSSDRQTQGDFETFIIAHFAKEHIRSKNRATIRGVITSQIQQDRTGYTFTVTTVERIRGKHHIATHHVWAKHEMSATLNKTQYLDVVTVEGPLSSAKTIILTDLYNESLAKRRKETVQNDA